MTIGIFPEERFNEAGYTLLPREALPRYLALDPGKGLGDAAAVHLAGGSFGALLLSAEAERRGVPIVYSPMMERGRGMMRLAAALGPLAGDAGKALSCMRRIVRRAGRVAAMTRGEAETIAAVLRVPREAIAISPPSYDPAALAAATQEVVRLAGPGEFVAARAGGADDPVAQRLFAALGKINVPVLVFGCGPSAPPGTRPGVTFVGDSRLLIPAVAASRAFADVAARPSRMLALSAAAAGSVPVVAQRRGMEEIFGEDAEYVEPTSWELMHHGVTAALNREKRSPEIYRERFAPSKAADALAALYRPA